MGQRRSSSASSRRGGPVRDLAGDHIGNRQADEIGADAPDRDEELRLLGERGDGYDRGHDGAGQDRPEHDPDDESDFQHGEPPLAACRRAHDRTTVKPEARTGTATAFDQDQSHHGANVAAKSGPERTRPRPT